MRPSSSFVFHRETHRATSRKGSADNSSVFSRPLRVRRTSPARSSTLTCLHTPVSDIENVRATSEIGDGPCANRPMIARRVGSEIATMTFRFTIAFATLPCQFRWNAAPARVWNFEALLGSSQPCQPYPARRSFPLRPADCDPGRPRFCSVPRDPATALRTARMNRRLCCLLRHTDACPSQARTEDNAEYARHRGRVALASFFDQ